MKLFYHTSTLVMKHSHILSAFCLYTCTEFRHPFLFLSLCSSRWEGPTDTCPSLLLSHTGSLQKHSITQLFAVLYVKADLGML